MMFWFAKVSSILTLFVMATAEAAKKELTTVKRLFTRTKNGLKYALDKQDDLEIIEQVYRFKG